MAPHFRISLHRIDAESIIPDLLHNILPSEFPQMDTELIIDKHS